jgi:hypothetical protein
MLGMLRSNGRAAVRITRNRVADLRLAAQIRQTPNFGRLPDFIVVGATKSGTTSLSGNLRLHPQIFMPPREVKFFNDNFHRGLSWYRRIFVEGAGKVCGEKTPDYMRVRRYMQRIHKTVPHVKIIVLLRDPVARLMSEINHRIQAGRLPAAEEIDGEYMRKVILGHPLRRRQTFDRGFYLKQIRQNILPFFPRERVLIRTTDERARTIEREGLKQARRADQLIGDDRSDLTLQFLNDICDFLEVERFTGMEPFKVSGVRVYTVSVTDEAKKIAYDLYAEENARLAEFLGYDMPAWREEITAER